MSKLVEVLPVLGLVAIALVLQGCGKEGEGGKCGGPPSTDGQGVYTACYKTWSTADLGKTIVHTGRLTRSADYSTIELLEDDGKVENYNLNGANVQQADIDHATIDNTTGQIVWTSGDTTAVKGSAADWWVHPNGTIPEAAPAMKAAEPAGNTTTLTPWDSSASSLKESDSTNLDSSYSGSFETNPESSESSAKGSVENSGSAASGSSGSYMQLWQWGILGGLCCVCCCSFCLAGRGGSKKTRSTKKKPSPSPAPAPLPEPEEPLPELAPLMPLVAPAPQYGYAGTPMQYAPTYSAGMQYAPAYSAGYGYAPTPGYVV